MPNSKVRKIKSCPICGGAAYVKPSHHWSGGFQICCGNGCVRTKKIYGREEEAIEFWNRRTLNVIG